MENNFTIVTADDGTKICASKWFMFDRTCPRCNADRATEPRVSEACVDCCRTTHLVGLCAFGCPLSKMPFYIAAFPGSTWCNCGDHEATKDSAFDVCFVNTGEKFSSLSVSVEDMTADRLIEMHCANVKRNDPLLQVCSTYGRVNLPSQFFPPAVFPGENEAVQHWAMRVSGTQVASTALMSDVMPTFPVVDAATTTLADVASGKGVKSVSAKASDYVLIYKGKPIPAAQYVWSVTDGGLYDLNFDLWMTKEWMERDQQPPQAQAERPVVTKKRERDSFSALDILRDPVRWFEHFGLDAKDAVPGKCFTVDPGYDVIICVGSRALKHYDTLELKRDYGVKISGYNSSKRTHGILLPFDSSEKRAEFFRLVEQLNVSFDDTKDRNRLFGLLGAEFLQGQQLSFLQKAQVAQPPEAVEEEDSSRFMSADKRQRIIQTVYSEDDCIEWS